MPQETDIFLRSFGPVLFPASAGETDILLFPFESGGEAPAVEAILRPIVDALTDLYSPLSFGVNDVTG